MLLSESARGGYEQAWGWCDPRYCTLQVFDYVQENVRPGDAVLVTGIFEAESAYTHQQLINTIRILGLKVFVCFKRQWLKAGTRR